MTMTEDLYEAAGYGEREVGFGERPAVLVVDFQNAVTRPEAPMGKSKLVASAVAETAKLLEVARDAGVPVIFCATYFRRDRQRHAAVEDHSDG